MKAKRINLTLIAAIAAVNMSLFAQSGYQVGDKARDFRLKSVDGKMISMADQAKVKGYLLIFSCNTCPYVVAYEDRIIALHNTYAPKGFPVIAINPNDAARSAGDSFENMKIRAKSKNFPFPYVHDETQAVAKAYGATNTPQVYLVVKEGSDFVVNYIGAIDNNYRDASDVTKRYVEEALEAILAGEAIKEARTKAIGCTIKWRKS